MAFAAGTRFGAYEIIAPIGAGGMGEVYRATDTKLGRDVAIKTLPSAVAGDQDRLARFEREAKLLAALNHPHIASVYGLDEHEGVHYLAMELVEGETLEERLKAGALPVEDVLQLALQIAEALEAAHEKGVVHRDLKPANIMVTPNGAVKVLDFGLAKAFSGDPNEASPAHSPALSLAMTQAGLVLGTAGYMSPEQASGQATDQRADVWAFGVVVYEMLTGLPLFSGESVPHILAAVLQTAPDWGRLPKDLNPRIRQMLERCLAKKPRSRYAGVADARVDIEAVLDDPRGVNVSAEALAPVAQRSLAARVSAATAFVVVGAGLAVLAVWLAWPVLVPPGPPGPVNRFEYAIPTDHVLRRTANAVLALSPDGRRFVYNTLQGLYLRSLDDLEPRLLSGTQEALLQPFFSPDGQTIAYWHRFPQSLRRIAITGGASVLVASVPDSTPLGESWHADGTIFFAQDQGGIFRVPATGGSPELVVAASQGESLYGPRLLPDGDSLMFSVSRESAWDAGAVVVQSLTTAERKTLIEGGNDARYVPTGHIVYAFEDGLFGIAFDLETLSVSGGPVPLVQGVMRATDNGAANYAVADDGTLVYMTGSASQGRTVVWVDREGNEEPIDLPPRGYVYVQLSLDGTRLALDSRDEENDIWIFDLARETLQRLTFDAGVNRVPFWSPDGERVVFSRALEGGEEVYWQSADGSGRPEALTAGSGEPMVPSDLTPDGDAVLYFENASPRDVWIKPIGDPDAEPTRLLATEANEYNAQVSPDGRWIAYQSDESGRPEVYVRPFPAVDTGRWQISTEGGARPRWSRDGSELFYIASSDTTTAALMALMAVEVDAGASFRPGQPRQLFIGNYAGPNAGRFNYDVSLDGERFLMIKNVESDDDERPSIVIVENWLAELERLVPTR
jgi:Tol biopolymer transport system component